MNGPQDHQSPQCKPNIQDLQSPGLQSGQATPAPTPVPNGAAGGGGGAAGGPNVQGQPGMPAQSQSDIIIQSLWDELQRLMESQSAMLKAPTQEGLEMLASAHAALGQRINALYSEVTSLWTSTVLQPQDLQKAKDSMQELRVVQRQLGVLHEEFEAIMGVGVGAPATAVVTAARPGATLAIRRQPFPHVFRKGEQMGEQECVVVKLIPSTLSIDVMTIVSQVRVQVVCDSAHQGSSSSSSSAARALVTHELIQPTAVSLDPAMLTARFPLHFLDGTKNAPVALKFSLQVLVHGTISVTLESELSAPFVVMTHKDQWKGAAGAMLKRESFIRSFEVPWPLIANVLQAQFLRSTKQALPTEIHRPLSDFDLMYLSKRFFGGRAMVDQGQFEAFWEWFGTTMDTLRHQRPVLALWWQGLVYGFASKEDVDIALRNEAPGTFIIRFSETFPGSFAIAYASPEGVKHYHVTPQDHALHKTLPDFIIYHNQFTNVLQLQIIQDPISGQTRLQLVRVNKVAAFESFCSKKTTQPRPIVPGYSELL